MSKQPKLGDLVLVVAVWGQSILLLFGFYSFMCLDLMDIGLPRFSSWSSVLFSQAIICFLMIYIFLWKIFNIARQLSDKRLLAYISLGLSLFAMFSSWHSAPDKIAERLRREMLDTAMDLGDIVFWNDSMPENWNDVSYWLDQPQEESRDAAVKILLSNQKEWWRFSDRYDRLQSLRVRHEYFDSLSWRYENLEDIDPSIRVALKEEKQASFVVNSILFAIAAASAVLMVLSELAHKRSKVQGPPVQI